MDDITFTAEQLAEKIRSGIACREYDDAKKTLKSHHQLYEMVVLYKTALVELNLAVMNGAGHNILEDEKDLSRMYQELLSNDVTNHFLECEKKLLSQLENVYNIIGTSCNIDFFER